jgi:sugar lactone lactonase YvrE
VYICQYGAGRILVTRPDGSWLRSVAVPYRYVTNVALNGKEDMLYVTAVKDPKKAPYPGGVFEIANR